MSDISHPAQATPVTLEEVNGLLAKADEKQSLQDKYEVLVEKVPGGTVEVRFINAAKRYHPDKYEKNPNKPLVEAVKKYATLLLDVRNKLKATKRKREIDEKDESNGAKKFRPEELEQVVRQLIYEAGELAKQYAADKKEDDPVVLQWIKADWLIQQPYSDYTPDIRLALIEEAKKTVADLKITKDTQFQECSNACDRLKSCLFSDKRLGGLDFSTRYKNYMFFCEKELEMYASVPSRMDEYFLGVYETMYLFVRNNSKYVNDEIIRDVIKNIYELFKKLKRLMSAKEEEEVWGIVGKLKSLIKNPNENDVRMHVAFNQERSNLDGSDIDDMINLIEAMSNKQSCDYRNLAWVYHLAYTFGHDIYPLQQAITALNSIPKQEQTAEDKLNLQQYEKEMPSTSSTFFSTSASAGSSMSATASSAAASASMSAAASVSSASNGAHPFEDTKSVIRHR